jgi:hypothetical protein
MPLHGENTLDFSTPAMQRRVKSTAVLLSGGRLGSATQCLVAYVHPWMSVVRTCIFNALDLRQPVLWVILCERSSAMQIIPTSISTK